MYNIYYEINVSCTIISIHFVTCHRIFNNKISKNKNVFFIEKSYFLVFLLFIAITKLYWVFGSHSTKIYIKYSFDSDVLCCSVDSVNSSYMYDNLRQLYITHRLYYNVITSTFNNISIYETAKNRGFLHARP